MKRPEIILRSRPSPMERVDCAEPADNRKPDSLPICNRPALFLYRLNDCQTERCGTHATLFENRLECDGDLVIDDPAGAINTLHRPRGAA